MRKILSIYIFTVLTACSVLAGASVGFKTTAHSPSDFSSWTFHWTMPKIDPDAKLQYVVLQPNGEIYFRYDLIGERKTGQQIRSDFSKGFAGGNPKVFYGKHITFVFSVDKGKIEFPAKPQFRFEFRSSVPATQCEADGRSMVGRAGKPAPERATKKK